MYRDKSYSLKKHRKILQASKHLCQSYVPNEVHLVIGWIRVEIQHFLFHTHIFIKKIDTDQMLGFIEGQRKESSFVAQKMILSELSASIFIARVFSLAISWLFGRLGI